MSTAEIAAVAAAVVVVLIIVVMLVSRGHGGSRRAGADEASMFDRPPSDTLAKLGKPENRHEEPFSEYAVSGAASLEDPRSEAAGAVSMPAVEPETPGSAAPEPHGEEPKPAEAFADEPAEAVAGEPAEPDRRERAEPAAEDPAARPGAEAAEPMAEGNLVPLSSIIVTTSNKIVDLDDPEIRRMLTDLVTFEIDQAAQFREQGQAIDAVLQLTEAEKICRALGKDDMAGEIHAMMRELQA
jgi:hypothetical protein